MNQSNSTKTRYEITLTQEAWTGVETIAAKFNLSVSELFEKVGCKILAIVDPEDLEDYLDLQDALEAESDPENQERIPWKLNKN